MADDCPRWSSFSSPTTAAALVQLRLGANCSHPRVSSGLPALVSGNLTASSAISQDSSLAQTQCDCPHCSWKVYSGTCCVPHILVRAGSSCGVSGDYSNQLPQQILEIRGVATTAHANKRSQRQRNSHVSNTHASAAGTAALPEPYAAHARHAMDAALQYAACSSRCIALDHHTGRTLHAGQPHANTASTPQPLLRAFLPPRLLQTSPPLQPSWHPRQSRMRSAARQRWVRDLSLIHI